MPVPVQLGRPVRRPSGQMVTQARWVGPDDDLSLEVSYLDKLGVADTISFSTANANENRTGQVCLPSSASALDIERDTVAAHLRMGSFLANALIGSFEWDNMWLEQNGARDIQLACGTCVVVAIRFISDVLVEIDIKAKAGNSPVQTFLIGVDELTTYSFVPSTQLRVIPGSVKSQFQNYIHDYPGNSLTESQKQEIVDYVSGLEIWV